jgi:hypothetical protein
LKPGPRRPANCSANPRSKQHGDPRHTTILAVLDKTEWPWPATAGDHGPERGP